eukprot:TRINITY_DN701_c0_g1::TRINITY_DN701_c0_g1_i1::g.18318::m.18318 TRINITY_DN701_c0_g1::TRINITY_DN701_c0_g1_i1::g.18318  ORF type:complete len:454 (+),score=129.40,sp/P90925/PH4H_CAEEL/53.32/2e-171,Biopterin_H/PF00351.16/2.8e-158,ACT/PF01842.20/1.1e-05,ACT/PF01842.20/6.7e+03,ACT_4/PF13291.1/0.00069,ACT_4/PF13291.1/1.1e+04 TRINITY_DN701_c0_g1_i1:73-1434(+)
MKRPTDATENQQHLSKAQRVYYGLTESSGADKVTVILTVDNRPGALADALDLFRVSGVNMTHIESRPSKSDNASYDFFINLQAQDEHQQKLFDALKACSAVKSVTVAGALGNSHGHEESPWFPRKISDLDLFTHKALEYGAELEADHPGFTDEKYRARRREIVDIAKNYCHGQAIPQINYTAEEIATWRTVYSRLKELFPSHAARQVNAVIPLLEKECGYGPDSIPQLEDVSRFLKDCTGWSLRPVSGLLSPRDFLNGLAFRVFHSTQYIRHHSKPFYTPEPDVCHELIGHVPLFADPDFAEFSQQIGIASLGATDDDIKKLATCYWFTVEFGLCKQDGEIKAYGAGLLSSFGELEHSLTDKNQKIPLDMHVVAITEYPITSYQPRYFVAESFQDAKRRLVEFASSLYRPFELRYNPYCQMVEVVKSSDDIKKVLQNVQQDIQLVQAVLSRQS